MFIKYFRCYKKLRKLKEVQNRIDELSKVTVLPKIGYYSPSTTVFLNGDIDALKYILDVMNGEADPMILPNSTHNPFKCGFSTINFWKTFGKYFYEMANYCYDKETKINQLEKLKIEEEIIKSSLEIK